jgi:arylformamidase|tara:strand:+ start:89 stop:967 length:879 start_codon:yes stop_codon:yes gene_type:complete
VTVKTVYRDYDQQALDAEYNLRPLWPDVPEVVAHRENESAAVRGRIPGRLNIAYGSAPKETLDVFPPSNGRAGGPALIYIHGGYWQMSDKDDTTYIAPAFLDAGIAFIPLNYTLAPDAGVGVMVDECRRAIAWIWQNAAEIGVDPERLYIAGHSAGGHLTAMMLSTDWASIDPALPAAPLKGACALSGLYDLEPIRLTFLNDVLGLSPDDAKQSSPLYLDPLADIPLILSVGELETAEFQRHQTELFAAWSAKGLAVEEIPAPGYHHYTIVGHFGDPDSALHKAILSMIRAD